MAQGNFRDYLRGEEVWIKKYFYVLRPLLAINWIEARLGAVPTEFDVLVDRLVVSQVLKDEIRKLLDEKLSGNELDRGPRIEPISAFIESELDRLSRAHPEVHPSHAEGESLNELFRGSLNDLWNE